MKFTIIDMDIFDAMLREINDLTKMVTTLHQNYGDKGLETWLANQDVCRILNINKLLYRPIEIPASCLFLEL